MDVRSGILAAANGPDEEKIRESIRKSSNLAERWDDPRCQQEAKELVQFLLRPKMPRYVALHESGHKWFFEKAGRTILGFQPPKIIYKQGVFVQLRSATLIDPCPIGGDDALLKMAEGYAAGGVCAARIMPEMAGDTNDREQLNAHYAGDTNDREQFNALYDKHYPGKSGEAMWSEAQKRVEKYLFGNWPRTTIDRNADKISRELFPWLRH